MWLMQERSRTKSVPWDLSFKNKVSCITLHSYVYNCVPVFPISTYVIWMTWGNIFIIVTLFCPTLDCSPGMRFQCKQYREIWRRERHKSEEVNNIERVELTRSVWGSLLEETTGWVSYVLFGEFLMTSRCYPIEFGGVLLAAKWRR